MISISARRPMAPHPRPATARAPRPRARAHAAASPARVAPRRRRSRHRAARARKRTPTSRATRIILVVLLLLAGAAAGGWYLWQRHVKEVARGTELDGMLRDARAALVTGTPGHWRVAQSQAQQVFAASSKNAEAAGISAEAAYASIFDD